MHFCSGRVLHHSYSGFDSYALSGENRAISRLRKPFNGLGIEQRPHRVPIAGGRRMATLTVGGQTIWGMAA
jgi:hypothetical protein